MKIRFTKHAREALIERDISLDKIKKTIVSPDLTVPGRENKTIYLKDWGKNYLKVVAVIEQNTVKVVTLHWVESRRVKRYNPN